MRKLFHVICLTCSYPLARQPQRQPSRRPWGCCPQKVGILYLINMVFFSLVCISCCHSFLSFCTICFNSFQCVFFCFSPHVDTMWTRRLLQPYGSIRIAVSSLQKAQFHCFYDSHEHEELICFHLYPYIIV